MLGIVFHGFVHPGSRVLTTRRTLARALRHASDMPWRCARLGHPGIGLRIIGFRANIIRAVLETRQPKMAGPCSRVPAVAMQQTPLALDRFQKNITCSSKTAPKIESFSDIPA